MNKNNGMEKTKNSEISPQNTIKRGGFGDINFYKNATERLKEEVEKIEKLRRELGIPQPDPENSFSEYKTLNKTPDKNGKASL